MILIPDYPSWLLRQGLRPLSIRNLTEGMRRILEKNSTITYESFCEFLYQEELRGISSGTLYQYIATIRKYTKFLLETNQPYDKKLLKFKFRKVEQVRPVERFTLEEMTAILNQECSPGRDPRLHASYSLFFNILARTGMRPNELATMKKMYVDLGRFTFTVIAKHSKTRDIRTIAIPHALIEPLHHLLLKKKNNDFLFTNTVGLPLSRYSWKREMKLRLQELGITRSGLVTYSFRHTFGSELAENDVSIFKIMTAMGHKRVETTMRYIHQRTTAIHNAVALHPLNRGTMSQKEQLKQYKELLNNFGLNEKIKLQLESYINRILISM